MIWLHCVIESPCSIAVLAILTMTVHGADDKHCEKTTLKTVLGENPEKRYNLISVPDKVAHKGVNIVALVLE